jgi:UDP-3-O-[3-hydroxymyristoyl] glucosamine N-acyltransferase
LQPTVPLTLSEIAQRLGGEVVGDAAISITGLSSADLARPGDLTFAESAAYLAAADQSGASAILAWGTASGAAKPLVRVANPRTAMARLLPLFFPPEPREPGIHPTATIDPSCEIHPTASIGPNCVVAAGTLIGARSVLMAGNYLGRDCVLAEDVTLFPNVVIYARSRIGARVTIHAGTVIGSDGYGYVFDEGRHRKVLQTGNVVILEDVEIGANTAIDRGAFGSTVIGRGTKIDNLVHVAHNVVVGANCLIMGQSGFAGSTRLGDYCVIASQSGIAGHLTLGRQSTVGAKSGVMRDVPDGGKVLGIPAMPDKQTKRAWIALQQLPELLKRTRELERQVEDLKAFLANAPALAED